MPSLTNQTVISTNVKKTGTNDKGPWTLVAVQLSGHQKIMSYFPGTDNRSELSAGAFIEYLEYSEKEKNGYINLTIDMVRLGMPGTEQTVSQSTTSTQPISTNSVATPSRTVVRDEELSRDQSMTVSYVKDIVCSLLDNGVKLEDIIPEKLNSLSLIIAVAGEELRRNIINAKFLKSVGDLISEGQTKIGREPVGKVLVELLEVFEVKDITDITDMTKKQDFYLKLKDRTIGPGDATPPPVQLPAKAPAPTEDKYIQSMKKLIADGEKRLGAVPTESLLFSICDANKVKDYAKVTDLTQQRKLYSEVEAEIDHQVKALENTTDPIPF